MTQINLNIDEVNVQLPKDVKKKIIVYSGGKTGSSTLYHTFLNNNFDAIHLHSFEYGKNIKIIDDNINNIEDYFEIQNNNHLYIIDSYRTPIERHISAFFQNLSLILNNIELTNIDINLLIYVFNKYYIDCDNYHPLDEEYPIFKNHIFDYNNNFIIKEEIKNNKKYIYIKIRFNDIINWDKILKNIFNCDIDIFSENISSLKNYSSLYEEFKKLYKVPIKYLEKNKKFDTFIRYNKEEEQEKYLDYWNKNSYEDDNMFVSKFNKNTFKNVPDNFDLEIYKKNNVDLQYNDDIEYLIHYELYGFTENKIFYK